MASHVAYWEALSFFEGGIDSPLTEKYARYYTTSVSEPFVLALGADAVFGEVRRIHEACKAALLESSPLLESDNPFREGWKWGYTLEYQAFHIAYHTGQMYSVRHLLGHETADN